MTEYTKNYVKNVLNVQKGHADRLNDPKQTAYYEGMRAMLEMILTEGWTKSETLSAFYAN